MTRTLVGVFAEIAEAEKVVNELTGNGFSRDDISLVAHRARCGPALGPVDSLSGGGPGAAPVLGGLAGFAAGMVALAVPGIGPILAAGPIAAELVAGGMGAATGAILGRLKQMGVPEHDAGCFCEVVRRGGVLVSVNASDEKAAEAERIIGEHRLVDIEDCAAKWSEGGWTGFDPEAQPRQEGERVAALPFDPESLRPSVRQERRERRAVRSYFRAS